MLRIARSLYLNRPVPTHDDVFQNLLGKRPERIVRIRRVEVFRKNLRALRAIRNRFQGHSLTRLNPPTHPRNAILDRIDRPPRNRNLRKPPQVVSRRLRHDVARRPVGVENRRQGQRPPLFLRVPQRSSRGHSRNPAQSAAQRLFNVHKIVPVAPASRRPKVCLCRDNRPRLSIERRSTLCSYPAVNKKSPAAAEHSCTQFKLPSQWSEHECKVS